VNKDRMDIR
jgi:uncharacterized membrane protein YcjF (UPF0283 family)